MPKREDEAPPPILCVWCSAPWSDENLQVYDVSVSEGCESCGCGSGTTFSISITCHACGKLMYKKEGIDA